MLTALNGNASLGGGAPSTVRVRSDTLITSCYSRIFT